MLWIAITILCGGIVGFIVGLIGGGGSIMATPLLLYCVGLSPHRAIGTGALAVSINAFASLIGHARRGGVRWRSAFVFATVGILGATIGSSLGKAFDGRRLLFLFAIAIVAVALAMIRRTRREARVPPRAPEADLPARSALLVVFALAIGTLAGFFGIGGGFLTVPSLLFATGMPVLAAIGTSMLAVGGFALTTAVNYAASGLIVWPVALEFIAGGLIGTPLGIHAAARLSSRAGVLSWIFIVLLLGMAAYMLYRNAVAVGLG